MYAVAHNETIVIKYTLMTDNRTFPVAGHYNFTGKTHKYFRTDSFNYHHAVASSER